MRLEKYSIGVGDRFALEAEAQLRACVLAAERGIDVIPVWNKSNREHLIVGSGPAAVQAAAAAAVKKLNWRKPWHVDADHIRLETVDRFLPFADFYTIDVADSIGKRAPANAVKKFVDQHAELSGRLEIPGIDGAMQVSRADVERAANKFLFAVQEAAVIYRHIAQKKGEGKFITEVSMDETDVPQTPVELLIILAAIADEGIPAQTIAPKFTGRFNKGVDYVGDVAKFEEEFSNDVAAIAFAVGQYGLPANLKLSVHSGSDKFSIYAPIRRALETFDAGVHLKTAGTTWLEEVIGLSLAGEDALDLAKAIYSMAYRRQPELCGPYATVIDIKADLLPTPESITKWTSEEFAQTLQHEQSNPRYNPSFRQLIHVGYKVASEYGVEYTDALKANKEIVGKCVADNIYERHIKRLFVLE